MWKNTFVLALALMATPLPCEFSRGFTPHPYVESAHPEWSKDAVIYQLNTRQFSPEGTFKAAEKQLPRLKALGIDIVWLMPVQPIGVRNRKGTLGSPYSVRDYFGVNPEFGSPQDLKDFIGTAHKLGMRVILDWVGNHTSAQHPWFREARSSRSSARRNWYLWRDARPDGSPPASRSTCSSTRAPPRRSTSRSAMRVGFRPTL